MKTIDNFFSFLRENSDVIVSMSLILLFIGSISLVMSHIKIFSETHEKYFNSSFSLNFKRVSDTKSNKFGMRRIIAFEIEFFAKMLQSSTGEKLDFLFNYAEKLRLKAEKQDEMDRLDKKTESVVRLFVKYKSTENLIASAILILTLIAYEFIAYFVGFSMINIGSAIITALILTISIDEYSLSYRVKKGVFGLNKSEAKEIVKFILERSKHNDNFNNDDGRKISIFDQTVEVYNQTRKEHAGGLSTLSI